jgi:GT2 family glycosyltransferase
LQALAAQTIDSKQFEILVVDDGSPEPLRLPEELGALRVRLIRQSNQGPAAARTRGAAEAHGKYLAFLDDDCRPEPGWLAAYAEHTALLAAGTLLAGLTRNASLSRRAEFNQCLVDAAVKLAEGTPAEFYPSNNFSVSAEAFAAVGAFDGSFPCAGGEDREFCARWLASGRATLLVPAAAVCHEHPQSIRQFWEMHARYGSGAQRLDQAQRAAGAPRASAIPKLGLLRETLRRAGTGAFGYFLISQCATAAGYFRRPLSEAARYAALAVAAALLLAAGIGRLGVYRAEFSGPDEAAHVVTSLMVREYARSAVWEGQPPMRFARHYYRHYPKVGLGHWPPGMYAALGAWMLTFGVSRLAIVAYSVLVAAMLGLIAAALCRRTGLCWTRAALAAVATVSLPGVLWAANEVNSDALCALAMLAAVLLGERWLKRPEAIWAWAFGAACAAAVLVKGTAFALAPAAAAALIATGAWRRLPLGRFLIPAIPVALFAGLWYWFTLELALREIVPGESDNMTHRVTHCIRYNALSLAQLGGGVLLALAFWSLRSGWWRKLPMTAALVPALILFLSFISPHSESRLLLAAAPVIVFAAARALAGLAPGGLAATLAAGVVAAHLGSPLPPKPEAGYVEAVRWARERMRPGESLLIASNGLGEGAWISELALAEPWPRIRVARGTKLLRPVNEEPSFSDGWEPVRAALGDRHSSGGPAKLRGPDDIRAVLDAEGISWLATAESPGRPELDYAPWLRAVLRDWERQGTAGEVTLYRRRDSLPGPTPLGALR